MAKILVVDDEPEIRVLTRMMLEKACYEVVEAENGEEGLRILEKAKPDLILLDVALPGLNGWKVCERIKADNKLRQIPVVMFTVMVSEEDILHSRKCGADAHINKPFDREELLCVIGRLLKEAE